MGKKIASVKSKTVNLFELGSLFQLNVGMWSGQKLLTRSDLVGVGINPEGLPDDIVSLGRKLLVPKKSISEFKKIEGIARWYLANWSIPFGICNAAFVPQKLIPEVEAKLREYQKEYYERVDRFIANFQEMKDHIASAHPEFWMKCLAKHYPESPEQLRKKFKFRYFIFKVSGIDAVLDAASVEAVSKLSDKKVKEDLMKQTMKQEVEKFVEEAVGAMRSETVKFCELVMARVNGVPYGDETSPKKLVGRSVRCFRDYVDRFKQLNIFGDEQIEQMLDEFREKYLDVDSPATMQSPQMTKAINEHLSKLRELALNETGDNSCVSQAKRRIEI